MTDPRVSQIINISQPDTTSEVAGSASVMPGYIRSDVPETSQVAQIESMDNSAVSSATAGIEGGSDQLSMNTVDDILGARQYINPSDTSTQALLWSLKDSGIINNSMTADQVATAINKYVVSNFSYQPEKAADHWQSTSETMALKGGDCEDLANLEASLMMAAFIDKGMSIEDADKRVSVVVTLNTETQIGHVYAAYTTDNGSLRYFDPSNSRVLSKIDSPMQVLFTYNAEGTDLKVTDFDYTDFTTAGYAVTATDKYGLDFYVRMAASYENILDGLTNQIMRSQMTANLAAANAYYEALSAIEASNHSQANLDAKNQAWDSLQNAIGLFCWAFGCTTSTYLGVYNGATGLQNYITENNGFWTVKWSSTLLTSVKDQLEEVKSMLAVLTMLYETKRDMRNLVSDELSGETGYRGMRISQIFSRKVNKVMETLEKTISDLIDSASKVNEARSKTLIEAENTEHDPVIEHYQTDSPPFSSADTRERDALNEENTKLAHINNINTQYRDVEQANMAGAEAMLSSMRGTTPAVDLGGNAGLAWQSLNTALANATDPSIGLPSIQIYTASTEDDPYYEDIDRAKVLSLRAAIDNSFAPRRIAMAAYKTLSEMRGLVHQEMTGISNRQSRIDVAEEMDESLNKEILNWFDKVVSVTESKVRLDNQIRVTQLQREQNQELINKMDSVKWLLEIAAACNVTTLVAGILGIAFTLLSAIPVVGAIFEFFATLCKVVALIAAYAAGLADARARQETANKRMELDNTYGLKDYKPGDYNYTARTVSSISTGSALMDSVLSMSVGGENDSEAELEDMTTTDYLIYSNDLWHSGAISPTLRGSTAFDTIAYARSGEMMTAHQIMMYLAESARKTIIEIRNLVHQEMTQIGGRSSSGIVDRTIGSITALQGYVANEAYTSIMEQNQSNNTRVQRKRTQNLYSDMSHFADVYRGWAYVPVVGSMVGSVYMNISNMYSQRDSQWEVAYTDSSRSTLNSLNTTARLEDPAMNALFSGSPPDGMLGQFTSGTGRMAVNYGAISNTRDSVSKAFITQGVMNSIGKAQMQTRSLVHTEMTNLGSSTGTELGDQVISSKFSTAMRSMGLITTFMAQKVQIANKVKEAKDKADMLTEQISEAEFWRDVAYAAGIIYAIAWIATYADIASFWTVVGAFQTAATIAGAIIAIGNAVVAATALEYAKKEAMEDMGALADYARVRQTMTEADANSQENRMDDLEQAALDEINANLLQNMSGGYLGLNSGLAAQYSSFIQGLYRGEQSRASIREMMKEMRSMVHEAMSGVSGFVRGSASTVLQMKMQTTLARVEDTFAMLQQVVERWNEIQDAKKEEVKAEKAYELAVFTAVIQTVLAIIAGVLNILESNAKLDNKNAADVESGKKTEIEVADDKNAQEGDAQKKADASAITLTHWTNILSYVKLAVMVIEYIGKIEIAERKRNALRQLKTESETQVENKGFGKAGAAKGSSVISANQTGGGWTEAGANRAMQLGQQELDSKQKVYEYRTTTLVDREYQQEVTMIQQEEIRKLDVWLQTIINVITALLSKKDPMLYQLRAMMDRMKLSEAQRTKIKEIMAKGEAKLMAAKNAGEYYVAFRAMVVELKAQLTNEFTTQQFDKFSADLDLTSSKIKAIMDPATIDQTIDMIDKAINKMTPDQQKQPAEWLGAQEINGKPETRLEYLRRMQAELRLQRQSLPGVREELQIATRAAEATKSEIDRENTAILTELADIEEKLGNIALQEVIEKDPKKKEMYLAQARAYTKQISTLLGRSELLKMKLDIFKNRVITQQKLYEEKGKIILQLQKRIADAMNDPEKLSQLQKTEPEAEGKPTPKEPEKAKRMMPAPAGPAPKPVEPPRPAVRPAPKPAPAATKPAPAAPAAKPAASKPAPEGTGRLADNKGYEDQLLTPEQLAELHKK